MVTGQAAFVVLATAWVVGSDVSWMILRELRDGSVDGFDSAISACRLGRDVGVGSSAVPVANTRRKSQTNFDENFCSPHSPWHWLWVQSCDDSELFGDAVKQEARHPQVVCDRDAHAWADLVFPLSRHDLGV